MSKPQYATSTALQRLVDTDLAIADLAEDIRGRKVLDRHGNNIAHISALFVDEQERKVRMLELRAGGFLGLGERHFLLPVEAITKIAPDEVHVNQTRERIVESRSYDPKLIVAPTHAYCDPLYRYYGLMPFWDPSYMYPPFSIPNEEREPEDEPWERDT